MKLQELYRDTRKAIDDYQLIDDGDKIAIGLSGGKDSLTLLYVLQGLRRFYPNKFDITAISVDLGFEGMDFSPVSEICKKLEIPFQLVRTDIAQIVFQKRKEKNPCSLCAKLRKGALNQAAIDMGCNKIAYAHHKDDVIETALLSLIYEGRFYCFPPKTHLDRTGLTVIRPMIYTLETDIIGFKNKYGLPVIKNLCPKDGYSKRTYVKELIRQVNRDNPGVKERIFSAVVNGNIEDWVACTALPPQL